MENAVEALEMAFAMFVFIIALTVALFTFGRAKAASDYIAYINDDTKYMSYVETLGQGEADISTTGVSGNTRVARRVKAKDIIPVLYSYSTETQGVIIDLGPDDGKYVFGIGSLGTFNQATLGTSANGNLSYEIYDWGAVQQTSSSGEATIKDYIDGFISGKDVNGVKKQYITEIIEDGQIIEKITTRIENNLTLRFGGLYPYLMSDEYKNETFVETYQKFSIANNTRGADGEFLKYKSEDDESEDKEYIYITYTLESQI